jgi:hypothetical protein
MQVSSAKRPRWKPGIWGVSFIYVHILYNVGERMKAYITPASISLGVDIPPSTKTLQFSEKK